MTDNEIIQFLKNKFGAAKRANKDWIRIRCPTCNTSDAYKMKRGVNLRTLGTRCWICNLPLALEQIFGGARITINSGPAIEPPDHPQSKLWPCKAVIPVSALPKDHAAVKFLEKDHLTDMNRIYIEHQVGFILPEDAIPVDFTRPDSTGYSMSVADSLIFPVYFQKEFIGWQCRFIPGTPNGDRMKKMKYLHVFPKGKHLYGYDKAREFKSVVVVEGVKKSWKFPNGVATFGKGITDTQVQLIQRWDEVILMYDAGEDTQKKARELADLIKKNRKCVNIDPGAYGFDSPDEMTEEQAQKIVVDAWLKAGYTLD